MFSSALEFVKKQYTIRRMKDNSSSRRGALRVPRKIENVAGPANGSADLFSVRQGAAIGFDAPFNAARVATDAAAADADWERVCQIPCDASELVVLTRAKKLGAYVMAISMRTPQKFRATYVARMQNFCLDVVECILRANAIRADGGTAARAELQTNAIIKLKMLGYVALLAQNAGCILLRQYRQISIQLADVINLLAAWRKSDAEKRGMKNN